MTMHNVLHPRDDIDRLSVSRKEDGRGLASIENCVDSSTKRSEEYMKKKNPTKKTYSYSSLY